MTPGRVILLNGPSSSGKSSIGAALSVGNHVIMDYPLSEAWRVADLLTVLDGYDVTLVDVVCSQDELVRREALRGDRPSGLAASQNVYQHADRDLTIDSTTRSAHDCARAIADGWSHLPRRKAFDRLRDGARTDDTEKPACG